MRPTAESTGHHKAAPGADLATGHGIADATKATLLAKTRAAPAFAPALPGTVTAAGGEGVEGLALSLAMAQDDEG